MVAESQGISFSGVRIFDYRLSQNKFSKIILKAHVAANRIETTKTVNHTPVWKVAG